MDGKEMVKRLAEGEIGTLSFDEEKALHSHFEKAAAEEEREQRRLLARSEGVDWDDPDFPGMGYNNNPPCIVCGSPMDSQHPYTCFPVCCRWEERVAWKKSQPHWRRGRRERV